MMANLTVPAQTTASSEYQLKAVFLFNFTQFVEWPPSSFATDEASMVIGILGDNPFGSYLEETVAGEKVNGHPVTVRYYKKTEEIKTCHILFINFREPKRQEQAVADLRGRNILTVSDAPKFPEYGGVVKFFKKENRIKIQINLAASKAADLVISSKLLRLAEIFDPRENN